MRRKWINIGRSSNLPVITVAFYQSLFEALRNTAVIILGASIASFCLGANTLDSANAVKGMVFGITNIVIMSLGIAFLKNGGKSNDNL